MHTVHQGQKAEEEACRLLIRLGMRILSRNFRCRSGEIDVVAEHYIQGECELVFVEVKHRALGAWFTGVDCVGSQKRRRLMRTARFFLSRYRGRATSVRFDILTREHETWTHTPNAWNADVS